MRGRWNARRASRFRGRVPGDARAPRPSCGRSGHRASSVPSHPLRTTRAARPPSGSAPARRHCHPVPAPIPVGPPGYWPTRAARPARVSSNPVCRAFPGPWRCARSPRPRAFAEWTRSLDRPGHTRRAALSTPRRRWRRSPHVPRGPKSTRSGHSRAFFAEAASGAAVRTSGAWRRNFRESNAVQVACSASVKA